MQSPTAIIRTYGDLKVTFGALPVGYVRKNLERIKALGVGTSTFEQIIASMDIVHFSIKIAMGDAAPSTEAFEDAVDLLDVQDAFIAVLEASGFAIIKPEGDKPGEAPAPNA